MKKTIEVSATLDVSEILDRLDVEMNHDDLVEFVTDLDNRQEDWSFTLRLCDYFDDQRKLYEEDLKQTIAANGANP